MKANLFILNTPESKAVIDAVVGALREGKKVKVTNLGIFTVKDLPARKGRDPRNGQALDIPPTRKVRVRISSVLKKRVLE